jgi:hypothetical protein
MPSPNLGTELVDDFTHDAARDRTDSGGSVKRQKSKIILVRLDLYPPAFTS